MKKAAVILVIAVLAALLALAAYSVMPVKAPSGPIESFAGKLNPVSDATAVYRIAPDSSAVAFSATTTFFGISSQISGSTAEIGGDLALTGSHIDASPITIDARALSTGSPLEDRMIKRLSLRSDRDPNELIVFRPESIGWAGPIKRGVPFEFSIEGQLTLGGVTKTAKLRASLVLSGDGIAGTISGTIRRSDYGLWAPEAPFLASVSDEVSLIATIAARKQ